MRSKLLAILALSGCQFMPGTDARKIADAEKAVSADLSDPISAQFRNEMVTPDGFVCGEVNSKNHLGGYAGFTHFAYRRTDNRLWLLFATPSTDEEALAGIDFPEACYQVTSAASG